MPAKVKEEPPVVSLTFAESQVLVMWHTKMAHEGTQNGDSPEDVMYHVERARELSIIENVRRVAPNHKHQWVDVRNNVVQSGEMCLGCGAIRGTEENPQRRVTDEPPHRIEE